VPAKLRLVKGNSRPPRGHWSQLGVGKASPPPPLPEALPGDELEWTRNGETPKVSRPNPKAPEETTPRRKRPRSKRPSHHSLIVEGREHFDEAKESETGYLHPFKKLLVDIFVSKKALKRSLDTANEIFLAFEDRGHQVRIAPRDGHLWRPSIDERIEGGRERYRGPWRPMRPTVVFIGTVAIGLSLFELSEHVEAERIEGKYYRLPQSRSQKSQPFRWVNKEDMPSGRFCLRAYCPYARAQWERQWRESNPGDLLQMIPEILPEIEQEVPRIVGLIEEGDRQAELERQQWAAQKEKWCLEEEERLRAKHLKESREQLFSIIEDWGVAKRVETFFEDAERRIASLPGEERERSINRIHRARELLGGVDALQRFRDWRAPEERSKEKPTWMLDLKTF